MEEVKVIEFPRILRLKMQNLQSLGMWNLNSYLTLSTPNNLLCLALEDLKDSSETWNVCWSLIMFLIIFLDLALSVLGSSHFPVVFTDSNQTQACIEY